MNPVALMTKSDIVFVGIAIMLLPWLYIAFWGDGNSGELARIQVGKQTPVLISLQTAQRYTFAGPLGNSIIEVKDGRIRFISSPCKGKQCIHSGWLSKNGDFAACLPNLMSITVSGHHPRFDSINF